MEGPNLAHVESLGFRDCGVYSKSNAPLKKRKQRDLKADFVLSMGLDGESIRFYQPCSNLNLVLCRVDEARF